jgi:subtilisin family serine protease
MNYKPFALIYIALALGVFARSGHGAEAAHVPGRLLVGYRSEADPATMGRILLAHRALLRGHNPELRVGAIDVAEDASEAVLSSVRQSGLFEYAERDYYGQTGSAPNDPSYASQWHLPRIGGPSAWTISTGSSSVIVALVDSGVYSQHPDLSAKIVPGWNFVKGNADTSDVLGHGTAIAGTIAAATNNGIGVAGVNWRSLVMPLVAVDSNGFAAYSNIAAAIQYAADRGVRVINVSIGGTAPSLTLQRAVDYAWSKGSLVFASAMNEAVSEPYYPAACAHAIAVSATDSNDRLASFSNFGSWITLSAPGAGILTTAAGGGYSYGNGTSLASSIAAGVAALVFSINPALTNEEALSILKATADVPAGQMPSAAGDAGAPDPYFGWGRVNAYRAMLRAEPARTDSPHYHGPPHKVR